MGGLRPPISGFFSVTWGGPTEMAAGWAKTTAEGAFPFPPKNRWNSAKFWKSGPLRGPFSRADFDLDEPKQ
jgi:hypothetical protein